MIADRKEKLTTAHSWHLARIETLEAGRVKLLADPRGLAGEAKKLIQH